MQKILLLLTAVILVLLPFIWFPFGSLDLGGDASRAYFFDPLSYIYNYSFFVLAPDGINQVAPATFSLPLFILFWLLRLIVSPYLLITLFSGFKLIAAFFGMFIIVKEMLGDSDTKGSVRFWASFTAAIAYVFIPTMTGNWDRALLSHNQVFVNPISFYLMLMFLKYSKKVYLYAFLLFSFIFSANFGYTSTPPFFAFFPASLVFIILYVKVVLNRKLPVKAMIVGLFLFIYIQAFHLLPQIFSILDSGSAVKERLLDKGSIVHEGIRYFEAILPLAKTSNYLMLSYGSKIITASIILLTITTAFAIRQKSKTLVLTAFFFLITLFLLSGNITSGGTSFYKTLFYLPGFSMFRNFIGQWLFVFSFFLCLLLGFSFASVFRGLGKKALIFTSTLFVICMVIPSIAFITGEMTNKIILPSTGTKIADTIDSDFLNVISFFKNSNATGRVINFPLTDSGYQFVPGEKRQGAYISSSLIATLGGKSDFSGYQTLGQFGDDFLEIAKQRDYPKLKNLMKKLGIQFIVYNSDPFVLDKNNEDFLYQHVRKFLPNNQKEYSSFISKLGANEIYRSGYYRILEFGRSDVFPIVYATSLTPSESVKVNFVKVDPTKYYVRVENPNKSPYVLTLLNSYHPAWQVYSFENGKKIKLDNSNHDSSIKYPNMWLISPNDPIISSKTLIIENKYQQFFYIGLGISIITLIYTLIALGITAKQTWYNKK